MKTQEHLKLNSIKLKNFQNHEDTYIDLHPGVNVISGSSRNGKSAILRGVRLATDNKPSGAEFTPHSNPKAVSSSILEFGDCTVERIKSSTKNEYKLTKDGETKTFKAFGQNVPDEIKETLNLKDYHCQHQHNKYFLLQNTGSEIAAELNKVAGLEIIDSTQANINSIVNSAKSEISKSEKDLEKHEERIQELSFLSEVTPLIQSIDNNIKKQETLQEDIEGVQKIVYKINELTEKQKEIQEFLLVQKKYKELKKNIDKYHECMVKSQNLSKTLKNINELTEKSKEAKKKVQLDAQVKELFSLIEQANKLNKDVKGLSKQLMLIEQLTSHSKELSEWLLVQKEKEKLEELIFQYNDLAVNVMDLEITCGQITNKERRAKELELLLEQKKSQKEEVIKNMGICPLCGGKVK